MKKFFKRFLSLALIVATVLSIAVTAMAAYSTMYVNCPEGQTVRLRATASSSGTVLVNIPYGTAVQAEKYNNTWHKVQYGNYNGYMMSQYLSTSHPGAIGNFKTMYVTCTPGETVNLRSSASSTASIIARILNGTAVQAKYHNDSWYQVSYDGKTGYMMSQYLSNNDPNANVTGYEKYLGTTTLSSGSTGTAVKNLQIMLNSRGYNCGTADGAFGDKTAAAVRNFQSAKGLSVDGIAGPQTKTRLWEECGYNVPEGCTAL